MSDARPSEGAIRGRRARPDRGGRFAALGRVPLRELSVAKRPGRRVPPDRDERQRSTDVACVRFVPVHENVREARDVEAVLGALADAHPSRAAAPASDEGAPARPRA